MRITSDLADLVILADLGERLAGLRLGRNLTQEQLAVEAGVSKRTVESMESGHGMQLATLLRVTRVLGVLDRFDALLPEPRLGPMEQLRGKTSVRRRASGRRRASSGTDGGPGATWAWGEQP